MKRVLIFLFLINGLIGTYSCLAQGSISGQVSDASDQPVPFVSIGFVGTTVGTVSDQFGNYTLSWEEAFEPSSILKYSCMGFLAQEKRLSDLPKSAQLNITFQEEAIELKEVLIKPIALEEVITGNDNESTAIRTNLAISNKPNMNLGAEIGKKFKLKNKPHFVNLLKVFISANNFDTVTFRINF